MIYIGDMKNKNNVKAHIRATEDSQNNQTDGGALCDASCSASSLLDGDLEVSVEFDESSNWFKRFKSDNPVDADWMKRCCGGKFKADCLFKMSEIQKYGIPLPRSIA
jgi:hypothetical protein